MALLSLNYRVLAKRLIILPLVTIWLSCTSLYLLSDMVSYLNHHIAHINTVNAILAQSAATDDPAIIANKVQYTLTNSPEYESIMFFPVQSTAQFINTEASFYTLVFGQYYGVSEPVKVQLPDMPNDLMKATTNVEQLIGYINITVDLNMLRKTWLHDRLAIFGMLLFISTVSVAFVIRRLQRLTEYLPNLENLSQRILSNQLNPDDYQIIPTQEDRWIVEQALGNLLVRQKHLLSQIDYLRQQQQKTAESNFQQTQQTSNLQNVLTHEFKRAVNRIESGLQLLQHHYISHEQKEAVEMISLGSDDLTTKLNQIIQLSRIEKGQTTVTRNQFSPTRLISDVLEQYQPFAEAKGLQIRSKIYHADYVLEGDAPKIKLVLSSLIENAIKFTTQGHIDIDSKLQHLASNMRWTLQVSDTGIGIKSNDLGQIFEPFFQVDSNTKHSLNNQTVGLFIAKKLCDLIGAELTVESQFQVGTTFSLSIILADWQQHHERYLLAGKRLAIWHPALEGAPLLKLLKDTGAEVLSFNEVETLRECLHQQTIDMVIICAKISPDQVLRFVKLLRQEETTHRTLVFYTYDINALRSPMIESLAVSGVDYIEDTINSKSSLADIQHLADYLN